MVLTVHLHSFKSLAQVTLTVDLCSKGEGGASLLLYLDLLQVQILVGGPICPLAVAPACSSIHERLRGRASSAGAEEESKVRRGSVIGFG